MPSPGADHAARATNRRPSATTSSEHREAEVLDRSDARPGQMAIWARLTGEVPGGGEMTPATLGFLADMVPLACARSCGVAGAGTSLDNSLRIGEPADTEWVLLDL